MGSKTNWLKVILSGLLLASCLSAQGSLWTVQGTVPNAMLGYSVGWAPDQDGDGMREILGGAPESPGTYPTPPLLGAVPTHVGDGFVRVLSGATGATVNTLVGASPLPTGSSFGWRLLTPGDLDGDGVSDIVVGAPTTLAQGWVHVFSGATLSPLYAPIGPTSTVPGGVCVALPSGNVFFGHSLAAMGDVDGDGATDLLVGGPLEVTITSTLARCTVYSGASGAGLVEACSTIGLPLDIGWSLVGGNDVNADGVPDIITASLTLARIRSYSGVDGAMISDVLVPDSFYGNSMTKIPDQNGDGVDDLAVGAPDSSMGASHGGRVVIQSGTTFAILGNILGQGAGDLFGTSMDGAGDFDGDGVNDLAVGTGSSVSQFGFFGYVEVYSGASLHKLARITSPVASNGFGWSVAFVGDLNGDGWDELAIGAPFEANGTMPFAGAVYLVSGLTTPPSALGGVGLPVAGPEAVLTINGSPGPGALRVPVGIGQSFSIEMAQPSTLATPAAFTLFAAAGLPSAATLYPTLFGDFSITPQLAAPGNPLLFHVADSTGIGGAILTATAAPWAVGVPSGLPQPLLLTFQGLIEDMPVPFPNNLAITNAVILDVQ